MTIEDYKKKKLEEVKKSLGATRDFEPMFPSSFSGALKTLDDNTAKPIRYATNEAVKTGKPWEFFKGLAKAVTEEIPDVSGKEIAGNLGVSTKEQGRDQSKPLRYSGSGISESPFKASPAGMVGFGLENILDAENLIPAGKAMAVGGLAFGGLKKVGKELGENSFENFLKTQGEKVYHGTSKTRSKLIDEEGYWDDTFFSKKKKNAKIYADVWEDQADIKEAFVKLDNPIKVDTKNSYYTDITPQSLVTMPDGQKITVKEIFGNRDLRGVETGDIVAKLKEKGLGDGVVFKNLRDPENDDVIVSFSNKSIKTKDQLRKQWESTQANQSLTNSLGRPVHPTPEGQENFKKWFGDSKVVDEKGQPIVAYHGTNADFDVFDQEKIGQKDHGYFGKGFYFTNQPEWADGYSAYNGVNGSNIKPTFLKMKNPYIFGKNHPVINKKDVEKFTQDIKKNGYDGVIYKGLDGYQEFVVFDPTQIKSATGNSGKFNPKDPNILKGLTPVGPWMLYQQQKGEE